MQDRTITRPARYALALLSAVVVVAATWVLAVRHVPPSTAHHRQIAQVEKYVAKIEEYREVHGSYPDESTQAIVPRVEEGNPYFYEGGGLVYRIGFRTGFDEVLFYESQSRRWSFER